MSHVHTLAPFVSTDLAGVRWTEEEHAKLLGEKAFMAYQKYPGYTARCNGVFLAAAGVVIPYAGMGEGWVIAGHLVRSHVRYFHTTVLQILDQIANEFKLHRVQAMVRADFAASHRWMTHLGFEKEAVLKRYGIKGEDMTMYTRFYNHA